MSVDMTISTQNAQPAMGYTDHVQDFEMGVDSISLDYLGEQQSCADGSALAEYMDAGMISFSLHSPCGLTMRIRECSVVHQMEIDFAQLTPQQAELLSLAGNGNESAQRALLNVLFESR